jgi:signal transduction histidine kinase
VKRAAHSLRQRLVLAFALFAAVSALLLGAFCLIFVYVIEDSFFDRMLEQEAAHQARSIAASGQLATPLRPYVSVHRSGADVPPELARQLAPGKSRGEYAGAQGRHYHVRTLGLANGEQALLVAEVSAELVVRPRLPFILAVLGGLTAAILILTLATGYWLARRATAPLLQLNALVSEAAPGQLPQHFSDRFPENEIGQLARSLDAAMARIAGFITREQHFTRDASHELRTPLTVIDGAAQLLAAHALPPQAAQQVQRIRMSCAHMTDTVDTLLALAREELAPGALHALALLAVVERAVVTHAALLEGKQVEVQVAVDAAVKVRADPAVLAILVSNLVSNAFAHTREGQIRIAFEQDCLLVCDTGPGIAPEVRARLYEPGARGAASQGHGLGLSIASRLAARSGIGLEIDSSASGSRALLRFSTSAA